LSQSAIGCIPSTNHPVATQLSSLRDQPGIVDHHVCAFVRGGKGVGDRHRYGSGGAAITTSLSELPSVISNFLIEKTYTTIPFTFTNNLKQIKLAAAGIAQSARVSQLMAIRHKDPHRSREFIEFVKPLDAAYPARTAIKLILQIIRL